MPRPIPELAPVMITFKVLLLWRFRVLSRLKDTIPWLVLEGSVGNQRKNTG
jgi:hypothetical protein